jgi:hypothetical protein
MSKSPKIKPKKIPARTNRVRKGEGKARMVKLRARRPQANRQPPERKLAELKRRLLEISDLNAAASVLSWDEATYMPVDGANARGRQTATLRRLAHEQFVDPALGRLIDDLALWRAAARRR